MDYALFVPVSLFAAIAYSIKAVVDARDADDVQQVRHVVIEGRPLDGIPRFDRAALLVECGELGGDGTSFVGILGGQQAHRRLGLGAGEGAVRAADHEGQRAGIGGGDPARHRRIDHLVASRAGLFLDGAGSGDIDCRAVEQDGAGRRLAESDLAGNRPIEVFIDDAVEAVGYVLLQRSAGFDLVTRNANIHWHAFSCAWRPLFNNAATTTWLPQWCR